MSNGLSLIDSEEWRAVEGYEGRYEVSNLGRVRSLDRYDSYTCDRYPNGFKRKRHGRMMSPHINKLTGYEHIILEGKMHLVHRLVAKAFVNNDNNCPEVNHINEIKSDNRSENLEWTTRSGNALHSSYKNRGINNSLSKLTEDDVVSIVDLLRNRHLTYKEIGSMFNVTSHAVFRIKTGASWGWLTGLGKEGN